MQFFSDSLARSLQFSAFVHHFRSFLLLLFVDLQFPFEIELLCIVIKHFMQSMHVHTRSM